MFVLRVLIMREIDFRVGNEGGFGQNPMAGYVPQTGEGSLTDGGDVFAAEKAQIDALSIEAHVLFSLRTAITSGVVEWERKNDTLAAIRKMHIRIPRRSLSQPEDDNRHSLTAAQRSPEQAKARVAVTRLLGNIGNGDYLGSLSPADRAILTQGINNHDIMDRVHGELRGVPRRELAILASQYNSSLKHFKNRGGVIVPEGTPLAEQRGFTAQPVEVPTGIQSATRYLRRRFLPERFQRREQTQPTPTTLFSGAR